MPQHLVIVESPAKAKTINKYLGKDYVVKSSIGHIRDLPSGGGESDGSDPLAKAREAQATLRAKGRTKLTAKEKSRNKRAALIRRMGVDPDHGWAAQYEIMPGKERTVAELKAAAAKADTIYLASDLDREGEAIAWHLKEVLGGDAARFRRVTFSEITKPAIQAAFAAPTDVNMDRVNAQQARRFLDRVVGFEVSPLLWSKVARGLSAGRVQSVAVRLIVEREREISAFVPEEYWEIHAQLTGGVPLRAQVVAKGATTFPKRRLSKAESDAAVPVLKTATYTVAEVERKGARDWPNPPFKTSTLQAAASVRLGFSVKKTMTLAQRLYEAGHITYMRTDAVNLSADAVAAIRSLINARFGADYVPEKAIHYKAGANAQEAHEAIRPSDISALAESLDAEPDQKKLYELIWRQTVACQMPPAEYDTASATIHAGGYTLSASGRVLRFAGWHAVMPPLKREDQPLPPLTAGQTLRLDALDPSRHFTTPPARYSEASLVKELEKRGIGRPSTYAAIISTIQERGYVRLDTRRFFAEKLGDIVTGRLMQAFPDLMDYEFTRSLEGDLDTVAEGKADWKKTLDTFYQGFTDKLEHASERMLSATLHQAGDITCPTCSRPMSIRTGSTGVFLSCTGYGLPPKERCVKTMNLVPGIEAEAVRSDQDAQVDGDDDQGDEADALALNARKRCTICGSAMDAWLVDATRKLHICARNPDCAGVQVEIGAYKIKGYDGPSIPCDKCGKQMQLRTGRFGKYFACTGYPECANTRKLLRSGEAAPPKAKPVPMPELKCEKGGYFVLRDGAAGIFLASNLYPKVRETRNPLVSEVAAHRSALDPKHHYLCDAPQRGADGKPTVIRYARTDKQQYVASEDGAQTWFLVEGRWVLKAATPAPAKDKSKRPAKAR